MKKLLVLGITAAFVLAAAAGAAGLAYAQTAPQTDQPDGAYECPMGGPIGGQMFGRMGGNARGMANGAMIAQAGGAGFLHEYRIQTLADGLGLTPETLNDRLAAGDTVWTIAQELGLTQEQFRELMAETHAEALQLAVEAGLLTQDQVDNMQSRMQLRDQSSGGGAYGYGARGQMMGRNR
jgi:hypothetical protein